MEAGEAMKSNAASGHGPILGVVVIGRNERARLGDALGSVLREGAPLVYVDSQSVDGSVGLAEELGVPAVVLSNDRPVNASRARNAGFAEMLRRHPAIQFVHFLDGDATVAPGWLVAAVTYLAENPAVGFVSGRLREKNRDGNLPRRLCDMEWHCEPGDSADCGGIGVVRVSAFQAAGGFDESLIAGADPALYVRLRSLGWKVVSVVEPMGVHDSGMQTWRQWWTRSVKGGYAYGQARLWGGWRRERLSALGWAVGVPAGALLATVLGGFPGLAVLGVYPLQVTRIWLGPAKRDFGAADRWLFALSCVAIKFPQAFGIATFEYRRLTQSHGRLIEYK